MDQITNLEVRKMKQIQSRKIQVQITIIIFKQPQDYVLLIWGSLSCFNKDG